MRTQIKNASVAFFILILIGFTAGMLHPEATLPLLSTFTEIAADAGLYNVEGSSLMVMLLVNNLFSALLPILLGIVPFLRLSALSLGLNALLLGAFAAYYQTSGLGLAAYLAGTLPHGLTELAALAVSCGAGLYLCDTVTGRTLGREMGRTTSQAIASCMKVYARLVVPLLFISALLEAFVTPRIFALFMQ